jgi:adenine-specific DNA-methyltransferase
VSEKEASTLAGQGLFPGDPEFDTHGIFESVTKPRIVAAATGRTPSGTPVKGSYDANYLPDHAIERGFVENVAFFRLDYLDPDVVSVGRQYSAIAPLLWLAAGSVGRWADREEDEPWSVPESSNYAVLFDEDRFAEFKTMIEDSERIGHVWLVTNSSQSFAEMRSQLPEGLEVQMLYRDYLSNFRVNTAETFS